MSNKTFAKLLSIILSIAICATAVLGCLITVNAQNGPSYVVSETQLVKGATDGSVDATFTIDSGMAAGFFTVDNPNNWYTAVTASVKNATPVEGAYNADDFVIEISKESSDARVSFETAGEKLYSTVVLTLNFTLANGIEDDIAVTLSDLDFSDLYENYSYFNATNGKLLAGCSHKYTVSGTPVYTDAENEYAVYSDAVCELCGESKGGYQVKPVSDEKIISEYTKEEAEVSLLDPTQPNSESNPYIIASANQMYSLMIANSTNGGVKIDTAGKFFKVADGIDSFYMNGGATVAAMTTPAQVKEYFEVTNTSAKKVWSDKTRAFKGTFDGNGVTIYGIRSDGSYAGLFPFVDGDATIKNVTVKNSYLVGSAAGGIVGTVNGSAAPNSITVENVQVINNYISGSRGDCGAGGLFGFLYSSKATDGYPEIHVNNCIVAGNELVAVNASAPGAFSFAGSFGGNRQHKIKNSIFLGGDHMFNVTSHWAKQPGFYENVYTDADLSLTGQSYTDSQLVRVTTTTGAGVKEAMPNLAWDSVWFAGKDGQYPTIDKEILEVANATDSDLKLIAVNIEYANSGNFNLNFHYTSSKDNVILYVPNAKSAQSFQKVETSTPSLYEGAKMFTIYNLSAKDIEVLWLPTIVAIDDEIIYGKTEQISIEDYAYSVIDGKAFYPNSVTDAEKEADKKIAAALVNYGYAAKDAIASTTAPTEKIISEYTKDEAEVSLLDPTQPNSESNPYIIANANQMYSLMIGNSTNGGAKIDTAGKFFKVADGIGAFYMNGGATVAAFTTPAQVKEYFTVTNTSAKKVWSASSKAFKGTFDGNGVTIYGIRSDDTNAGLFPFVDGDATIKNVTVKNSYLVGATGAGLVGSVNGTAAPNSITAENCQVINNYISGSRGDCGAGGLFGFLYSPKATDGYPEVHVNNCIVAGNELVAVNASAPGAFSFVGSFGGNRQHKISNSIFLGGDHMFNVSPWWAKQPSFYENVYTDADLSLTGQSYTDSQLVRVTTTTGAGVKEAMPNLDWDNVWCCGAEGKFPVLAPRTEDDAEKKAVYWVANTYDDDFIAHADQPGNGTEGNPYIIYDAEDLASVVAARVVNVLGADKGTATPIDTTGVHFKVADGIDAFYMAQDDPTYGSPDKWDTMEKVKAALSNKANVYKWWTANEFKGCFDGNGATVYGLFADKERAALFHKVGTTATIKNITIANSYLSSTSAGFAGGLIGSTSTSAGAIVIENCGVINNYIHSAYNGNTYYGGAGAIVGNNYWGPKITINNCLVIGNDVGNDYAASLTTPGLVGFTSQGTISNTIVIGSNPYIIADAANTQFGSIQKSAKAENYTNIYTDADISVAETLYGVDYADNQLKQLTTAQMQGDAAIENMSNLAWGSILYAGNRGEYPSLSPVEKTYMPADVQAEYNALVVDNYDSYAQSTDVFGVYATSLTLKNNPYISFTFAFSGEYKQNPDVVVTFTAGSYTKTVTAAEMTNNEGAGRYHLYRLKDAPVKALCDGITVTASYGGNTYNLGTYSAEGFALEAERANRINPCDYYATRYEAAKALLFYSQMLKERYGA